MIFYLYSSDVSILCYVVGLVYILDAFVWVQLQMVNVFLLSTSLVNVTTRGSRTGSHLATDASRSLWYAPTACYQLLVGPVYTGFVPTLIELLLVNGGIDTPKGSCGFTVILTK